MAELSAIGYRSNPIVGAGGINKARTLEFYVDFTRALNQTAAASDSINLFKLPAGTVVIGGGIEQVVVGSAGNTLVARFATTALSGTLASDAAVGTITAGAVSALSGDAQSLAERPYTLTADSDFNLLGASAVRATGKVRAWVVIKDAKKPYPAPTAAARDTSTGLS